MVKLLKLLLVLFILLLSFGQLGRIPLGDLSGAIYIHDGVLFILIILFFLRFTIVEGKLTLPIATVPLLFFICFAFLGLVNSLTIFPVSKVITGSFFLVRFCLYFSLYLLTVNILKKGEVYFFLSLFLIVALVLSALGFLQLIFFYDLSGLSDYGWDPHIGRLVSTFLDPNYLGAFLLIAFCLSLSLLFFNKLSRTFLFLPVIYIVAIVLTFSRSSYLASFVSVVLTGVFKSRTLLLFLVPLFIFILILIPRSKERISGAINLDVTAQARIESWQNASTIISDNFLLGVGYNNYRFAQGKYGFFKVEDPQGGLSGAGTDSSLLLVLATTGIFGLISFLVFLGRILVFSFKIRNDNPIALGFFTAICGLIINSQFVNSLFYPPVMAFVFIALGLLVKSQEGLGGKD